ncbi:MAG: alpha/beta fold hydrolase [Merismopedia sp. SIO2A8]|nr:alpha/beta fold hydrolase [Symploca sp. SIO2B6]NET50307.1 alpha/beta fold hydrolase [Merismopedia sp. SIO2A8]
MKNGKGIPPVTTQINPINQTPLATPQTKSDHSSGSTWLWRGYSIRYQVYGDQTGQPLVLIHGFGASIGHWRKNSPVFAEAGYQVFVLDLLGFGASTKPPLDYSLELWEALLADFWQEHIQTPAVFIGNSIGGLLALMMLAHHPQMSAGGVLLNCAGGLNHRPDELNPVLRTVMGTFTKVVSAPVIGPLMFNEIRRKFRLRSTLKQVYGDRTAVTDELVEMIYEPTCDPDAQKVFASILTAPPGPKPSELLPQITQPLLVLWGDADPWTPISGSTIYQDLAKAEPERVTFQGIPNAGHCPHDECPDKVNPPILHWLSSIAAQPSMA